ncbi:MAG: hypothetical protein AAF492_04735, partial [Verrucomicrobiota bacterium]
APEKNGNGNVAWKNLEKGVGPQIIDLSATFNGDNRAAYMKTNIYSPEEQEVRLEMGSDDGIKVWVNGGLVHAKDVSRGVRVGEDRARARFKEGWNRVLTKVSNGSGHYGFVMRVVKADGSLIDGMKVRAGDN